MKMMESFYPRLTHTFPTVRVQYRFLRRRADLKIYFQDENRTTSPVS